MTRVPVAPPSMYDSGGSNVPVVLIHGATATWRAWRPVLAELEKHHRVIAPTLAGHHGGPTLACAPHEVVPRIVDEMEERLNALGLKRAHLVGNSLGGWVALELARRGRATSVTALSPAGAWELPKDLDALLRLFKLGKVVGNVRLVHRLSRIGWVRHLVLRNIAVHGERMPAEHVQDMFDDMAGCAVLDDMIAGAPEAGPMPPFATEVDCPVRLAWSAEDRTLPFPRYGAPMVAAVPQAELVVLPDVGHVPMVDDPALVVRTILELTTQTAMGQKRAR